MRRDRLATPPAGHREPILRVNGSCFDSLPRAAPSGSGAQGFATQQRALADEGEVVVAAGCIGDGGAPVGRDTQIGQVGDVAAVDAD
jgi:hypothetical protein